MNIRILAAERLNDGLVRVAVTGSTRSRKVTLWVRAKARKPHRCVRCQGDIRVGDHAFRPMDNTDYRMDRLCESCLEYLIP